LDFTLDRISRDPIECRQMRSLLVGGGETVAKKKAAKKKKK
jgi:hypothetical protein